MQNIEDYIESGILELYVLGVTSELETAEVENMALAHKVIQEEIEIIRDSIEAYSNVNTTVPNPALKPFLMTMVNYGERMKTGDRLAFPPILCRDSKISDYEEWTSMEDMQLPGDFKDIYAKVIGEAHNVGTAIIWIKDFAPSEIHDDELEKFLILEGTCDITIQDQVYHLAAGDYLSIPLHTKHDIKITSSIPCKAILQRIAA